MIISASLLIAVGKGKSQLLFITVGGFLVFASGIMLQFSQSVTPYAQLDEEIADVLVEEGGLESPPEVLAANSVKVLAGYGSRAENDHFDGELGVYANSEVSFEVDGEVRLVTLVLTLDGEEVSIGVLDVSTSSVVPLSPESLLGVQGSDVEVVS